MEDGPPKNIYFHILIDGTMSSAILQGSSWTLLSQKSILSSFLEKNVFWCNVTVLLLILGWANQTNQLLSFFWPPALIQVAVLETML